MISKIAYIADLHFSDGFCALERRAQYLKDSIQPDILVLGGDISTSLSSLETVVSTFRKALTTCQIMVVAGNHDLWINNNDCKSSFTIYDSLIQKVCNKYNCTYLDKSQIVVEDCLGKKLGIVGSIGWYDYSAKYPYMPMPDEYYALNKINYNNDARFINFALKTGRSLSDIAFSKLVLRRLKISIRNIQDKADYMILFTHVPIFNSSIRYRENTGTGADWNTGSAYFYNLTMGEYVKTIEKMKLVVSGHTHLGADNYVKSDKSTIREVISASDYGHPECIVITITAQSQFEIDRFFFNNQI